MKGIYWQIKRNILKATAMMMIVAMVGLTLVTFMPASISAARSLDGSISGTVLSKQLKPIGNVTVSIMKARWDATDGLAEHPEWFELKTVKTAKNGTYKISVPPGTYKVWFVPAEADLSKYAREAYPDAAVVHLGDDVVVKSGKDTSRVSVTLEQGIVIKGKVIDAATTNPLDNIKVAFGYQSYSIIDTSIGSVNSDVNGDYTIYGLKPYPWLLWANTGWANPNWNENYFDLIQFVLGSQYGWPEAGSTNNVLLDLEPYGTVNVQGRILDKDGNPLSGITVELYQPDGNYWSYNDSDQWYSGDVPSYTTNSDGMFYFQGVQNSRVRLFAYAGDVGYQDEFYLHAEDNIYGAQDIYLTRGVTTDIGDWQLFSMYP